MRQLLRHVLVGLLALLGGMASAAAPEAIKPADVPAPVLEAISKVVPKAKFLEATRDQKRKEIQYDLRLLADRRNLKARIDVEDEGETIKGEVIEQLAATDLPTTIAAAARRFLKDDEIGEPGDDPKSRAIERVIAIGDKNMGEVTYEWELKKPKREVRISQEGRLVRVKEDIDGTSLPAEVLGAIKKAYPDAKLEDADRVIENGQLLFKIQVEGKDGKELELIVTREGKLTELGK